MNTNYILMNKNRCLAKIELSSKGRINKILDIYNIEAFPVGIIPNKVITNSIIEEIRNNLDEWWQGRAIPASRQGLISMLQSINIDSTSSLAVKSLGLSLSDQYWIKPFNSSLIWDNVNFFHNNFSNDIGEAFFNPYFVNEHINFMTPDNTSDGWLRKKWIIVNNDRCLVKAGSDPYRQEPFNEIIASIIMEKLNTIPFVRYSLFYDEGQGVCSICKNFITEDTELVSGYSLSKILPRNNKTSIYEHYLNIADKLQIPNMQDFFDSLIVLDYIIANTDRHHNNFGFIRDINTMQFLKPAPIFDSGTSLWHKYSILSNRIGTSIPAQPFFKSHEQQLTLVKDWGKFDFAKLNALDEIVHDLLSKNPLIDEKRNLTICKALKERIELIKLYQAQQSKKYAIDFDINTLLNKYKSLKFNFETVYYHYKNKFAKDKVKYNPIIDKQILKQILLDGFSIEQAYRILIYSPNIKSEKMIDYMYRSLSNNDDTDNIIK